MQRLACFIALALAACAAPEAPEGPEVASSFTAQLGTSSPQLTVERADVNGFVVRFRPQVKESKVLLGGKLYDNLSAPETAHPALPGTPAVPFFARPFAIPEGAKATVRIVSIRTHLRANRWLRPTAPNWEDDGTIVDEPIAERAEDYGSLLKFPATPATVRTDGARLAGVRSGVLQLSVARFTPSARTLEIVEELVVEVTFDKAFQTLPKLKLSQWAFAEAFINSSLLVTAPPVLLVGQPELLIITTDALRPAADRLAVWKEQKGIATRVVSTATIGTSPAAIKAYIQTVYNAPLSKLGYLLILGDAEIVATYYVPKDDDAPLSPPSMASDMPYTQLDGTDAHADIAAGRISVDTLAMADDVVDKTIDYEQTPSSDSATYDALTFVGYFQDDAIRASVNVHGVLVTSDANGGNDISVRIDTPPGGGLGGQYVALQVFVLNRVIVVVLGTNASGVVTSSWLDVKNAINANAAAAALVTASEQLDADDDGSPEFVIGATASSVAPVFLQGGMVHDGVADRPYVDVLESVRDELLRDGKTVDRLYFSNSTVAAGPTTFEDGSALPSVLLKSNGFTWDADDADIRAAFNAGRSIVWHRDHGSRDGWADPSFSIWDLAGLTNGNVDPLSTTEDRYPVVFSINCASGTFDQETDTTPKLPVRESFAEEILRRDDSGAVAVIAASRNSSTSRNQILSSGLFNAYYKIFVPFSTIDNAPMRLGDALVYAKDWVLGMYPDPTDSYSIDQVEMYHLHGDPTLEVWTEAPLTFTTFVNWNVVGGIRSLHMTVMSAAGSPYLSLWEGSSRVSTGKLISSTGSGAEVTRVYELAWPAGSSARKLFLTQPGYRPFISGVAPPN